MASWNDETEWTIQGYVTNRFAPKRYRGVTGVTGVTMVIGKFVWGWGVSGGRNNDQYRQRKSITRCEVYDKQFIIDYLSA